MLPYIGKIYSVGNKTYYVEQGNSLDRFDRSQEHKYRLVYLLLSYTARTFDNEYLRKKEALRSSKKL